jgi:hypothetical protein
MGMAIAAKKASIAESSAWISFTRQEFIHESFSIHHHRQHRGIGSGRRHRVCTID